MELSLGYKQTEIGKIPNDWKIVILEELTSKIGDGIHSTPIYDESGEYFFINGNNLKNGKIFTTEETKKVNKNEYLKHSRELGENTILYSINGTIGNIAYYSYESVVIGKSAAYINFKSSLLKKYLYYVLQSSYINKYFDDSLTGSTIKNLGLTAIRKAPLALPNETELNKIAQSLSDTDAYITSIEKLIEKKRQIKQGAMQELLRQKDGWETKHLGDIGKTFGGLSGKSKDDFTEGVYPYIPFMNIMSNPIIDTGYFDYVNLNSGESQNLALKGDLFFNGSSETPEEIGMCSVLLNDIPNLYLNSFCFGFRIKSELKINGLYLSYYFRSKEGRKLFFSMAQGATRYNLSKSNFNKLKVPIPTIEEQNVIAERLFDLDSDIKIHEVKLEKAKSIKQGMMQNLLTGKIRLI
jgi:type I restriction enzyme, S subunit